MILKLFHTTSNIVCSCSLSFHEFKKSIFTDKTGVLNYLHRQRQVKRVSLRGRPRAYSTTAILESTKSFQLLFQLYASLN